MLPELCRASTSPLADAAEKMDHAAIRALVKQRADVNAAQVDGMTALHWAAYHDDREVAELLVKAGANAKAANRYGVTPLSLACTNGNAAMVELLLKAGADPNAPLPGGETPLMTAARTGALPVVKALLAAGAAVDAKDDSRGQTALMWAAAEGHAAVVQALIAAGADVHTRLPVRVHAAAVCASAKASSASSAHCSRRASNVNEMVPTDGPRRRGYGGRLPPAGATPLLLAVANAHFELAAELLEAGANPNADVPGYTVLHAITAVRKPGVGDNDPAPEGSGTLSSLELVKKLAARGANLNARMTRKVNLNNTRANELGATPFFLAALTADAELMKTLVALGADPELTNVENSTPLMAAAGLATRSPGEDAGTEERSAARRCRWPLDLGADINAVDNNGETVDARRGLQEPAQGREVPRRQGREDRRLESRGQVRLDAAGDRGRLPLRQFQAVARHRGRHPRSDDRRRRHAAQDRRRQNAADLLAQSGATVKAPVTFETVTKIALTLPGVEVGTKYDGSPVVRVDGCFMAGLATHPSVEPGTLVVRADLDEREGSTKTPRTPLPDGLYRPHPVVLVRLSTIEAGALRELLEISRRLTLPKTRRRPLRAAKGRLSLCDLIGFKGPLFAGFTSASCRSGRAPFD